MQVMAEAHFDRSCLEFKLDPEHYFTKLLESGAAKRHASMREEFENNRKMVQKVWREGDELWYWRYRIDGGISGSDGLVVLRHGEIVQAWCNGCIL